jgi:threonine/homoserine/homoserine lactone efflux protein
MPSESASLAAAFAIGLAVASAPGPVQALVVIEAMRGGVLRGLAATIGAAISFWFLLLLLALGMSLAAPAPAVVRFLQFAGGMVVVWIAIDSFRAASATNDIQATNEPDPGKGALRAALRVAFAAIVFPGTWIFLAGIAAPMIATARLTGGAILGVALTVALVAGSSVGNLGIALVASAGGRVVSPNALRRVRQALAIILAGIGLLLALTAATGG